MNILVVAAFEDFDETLDKRQRGPGSGRKRATQALLRHLGEQVELGDIQKVDLVILDWKNPPKQGPKEVQVELRFGKSSTKRQGLWGSREQLLSKFPGAIWDVLLCSQARRLVLDFAAQLKARRHVAMLHDYNVPVGPWGQEQTAEQLSEHRGLFERFTALCASHHLAEFVDRWNQGDCTLPAQCCYAADYGYFEPVPAPMLPWEEAHKYVTMISPCPEKGLCIFRRLAAELPETPFLAVRSVAWTRPWHEQALKRLSNVRLMAATEDVDDVLRLTRVLIVPSVWQEAFGLVVTEAQLRGIPVISTGVCGLAEANRVASSVVADVPVVFDARTREVIVGMTMDEAESSLDLERAGALTMEQSRQQTVTQEASDKVASDEEVVGFVTRLRHLLEGGDDALRQASEEARRAACSFVDGQRGCFMEALKELADTGLEKAAAVSPSPQAARFAPPPRNSGNKGILDENVDTNFDADQDFTKVENFDGHALAARVLVRVCEQGNLAVAAELLQAKADVNAAEPEIGVTALVGAANAGHADICKYLLRKEADVNLPVADDTGRTALHAASQMGFVTVVNLLLEKRASPRVQDLTKTNPLHLAVRHGHAGVTELLLKHKANPNQSDDQGHVPINDGVAKDRFDLVTKLLEHGSLVNVRNMAGLEAISYSRTPTMQAIIMKNDVNF